MFICINTKQPVVSPWPQSRWFDKGNSTMYYTFGYLSTRFFSLTSSLTICIWTLSDSVLVTLHRPRLGKPVIYMQMFSFAASETQIGRLLKAQHETVKEDLQSLIELILSRIRSHWWKPLITSNPPLRTILFPTRLRSWSTSMLSIKSSNFFPISYPIIFYRRFER